MRKLLRGDTFKIAFADAPSTGYVIECGVGKGNTLRQLVKRASPNQLIFGFDSFRGLPEDWVMSDGFTWPKGSFANNNVPEVQGAELRIGYFVDTLPIWKQEHPGRIALLHFDADLYSSGVTVLNELNNQIEPGTVIVSDDHFEKPKYTNWEQGMYKAFNEWQEKYNRKVHLLARGIIGQAVFRVIQ